MNNPKVIIRVQGMGLENIISQRIQTSRLRWLGHVLHTANTSAVPSCFPIHMTFILPTTTQTIAEKAAVSGSSRYLAPNDNDDDESSPHLAVVRISVKPASLMTFIADA